MLVRLLCLGLLLLALPAHADVPPPAAVSPTAADPFALSDADLVIQATADLRLTRRYADAMQRVLDTLTAHPTLFDPKRSQTLTPDEERLVKTAWGALFDYMVAIESIRQRWWGFVAQPLTSSRHAWGFLVTHHALLAELGKGGPFAALATGKPLLEMLLDEADDDFGVPAGSFARFKLQVLHVGTSTQMLSGDAYLALARGVLLRHGLDKQADGHAALAVLPAWSTTARKAVLQGAGKLFFTNALDIIKDWAMRTVMPVQKGVAEWMGDTRVRRIGKPLIQKAQLDALAAIMRPGDIVLARQNWFLSNLGLPGFWPHAELYLGTSQELSAAFDQDPEVCAWVQSLPAKQKTLTAHLAAVHPQQWQAYAKGQDFLGHAPIRVIESISEGVSFTAAEHALQVDYLGVLRPRVPAMVKARAVVRAFGLQGRPYDFDFDFRSDSSLVCTELVWKCYVPEADGQPGLRIPLVQVVGRTTLPASEIVKLFDAEGDKPDRQLDFVAFLDGREALGHAVLADAAALRGSWKRVKWDVSQQ